MTKEQFIKDRPTAKPHEIVEAAKAAGLDISAQYVYSVRSKYNGGNGGSKVPDKLKVFEKMCLEIGVDAAEAVIQRIKSRLV